MGLWSLLQERIWRRNVGQREQHALRGQGLHYNCRPTGSRLCPAKSKHKVVKIKQRLRELPAGVAPSGHQRWARPTRHGTSPLCYEHLTKAAATAPVMLTFNQNHHGTQDFWPQCLLQKLLQMFKKQWQWALRQSTHEIRHKHWQHSLCFHRNTGNMAVSSASIRQTNGNTHLVQILGFLHLTIISYAILPREHRTLVGTGDTVLSVYS